MNVCIDYTKDKCLSQANIYILCMKGIPKENKCKDLFESWLKCINLKYK